MIKSAAVSTEASAQFAVRKSLRSATSCSSCGGESFRGFPHPDANDRFRRDVGSAKKANSKAASQDQTARNHAARISTSYDSIDNARFVPGEMLAERYRIVGLLGKGGMGEVYRADDLKLGQAVALKFLPEHLTSDGAALARFHREVRVARQVSHKNVCRVYDIGEVDGRHFLSMEYIKARTLFAAQALGRIPPTRLSTISSDLRRARCRARRRCVASRS